MDESSSVHVHIHTAIQYMDDDGSMAYSLTILYPTQEYGAIAF